MPYLGERAIVTLASISFDNSIEETGILEAENRSIGPRDKNALSD